MEVSMKRLGKLLLTLGIVVLVLAVIVAAAGTWFVRRPWPKVKGDIAVEGLTTPVEIIRDEWGVPHIYAENEHDLFLAQGYVHAQDRLWQMEFNRRVASGTLSAVLGNATLDTDRFMRTIGLRRAAEKDWALAEGDTRDALQAYADGVNAFIESHRNRLPLEFTILGAEPEPWSPVDTLAWGKVMSYFLCGNYDSELLRALLIAGLGVEAAQQLVPPYPEDGPVIVPPEALSYSWLRDAEFLELDAAAFGAGLPRTDWGSNNWVVHGSRTATGMPMLADDMHLGLDMPAVWYENGLHGGSFDSVGYSFPGVPMVIVGHNQRIAWAVTNLPSDVQDFYIEKLDDPAHPTQYEFDGEWKDLEVRYETIDVKGSAPVSIQVLSTHHGPIMNSVLGNLPQAEPLALKWTALEGTHLFNAVHGINLAANWDEFRQALTFWDAPSQNFVYADVEGNIGYQSPGKIPIRAPGHQGSVPVPGWTGEYEWQGFIPFDELPRTFNPPAGFIATANNKVVTDDYPYRITDDWAAPYRAQRITDLLVSDDSITIEDMQNIHSQTYSLPAEALRPYLSAVEPADDLQASAMELFRQWDLCNEADCTGASVFQVWYWFLVDNVFRDELGDALMDRYRAYSNTHMPLLIEWMEQPDNPWFDDVNTPEVETREDVVRSSLADAVGWLRDNYGEDPAEWEWGKLHTKTFVHNPLGQSGISIIEWLFNSDTIPARGDGFTVDAASYSFGDPFTMGGGVSQRYIADLSDFSNSLSIHTTGQSGHLFHPHREDFIPLWQNVEYHPMVFDREQVEANAEATLTLSVP
jgi:penicillin amidase